LPEERKRAAILYKALSAGRSRYLDGERSAQEIIRCVLHVVVLCDP
jgi:pantothenate synthetase